MTKRIVLIGQQDSGKTNFLARFVRKLRQGDGSVRSNGLPDDLKYIEEALAHLLRGKFAPRSHNSTEEISALVELDVHLDGIGEEEAPSKLSVPDVAGETWKNFVESSRISQDWLDRIERSSGAILFLRVLSNHNVDPLDWVSAPKALAFQNEIEQTDFAPPTQVVMCELLHLLEERLALQLDDKPKVAVVLTAYDLLDPETRAAGPKVFLQKNYPLFAGKIKHGSKADVAVFGASVVGGELGDDTFRSKFFENEFDDSGYAVEDDNGSMKQTSDLTRPVEWLLRAMADR